ncbi:hypothetical protein SKAU_G00261390 [Synaphobranchus kaupii]|uniref:C-type lectin domain-containing protein n=1 Tax=Synaphobranchus kaupii TaxID=118154 RepID=A0A9Q1INQ2_SYNKA|nr:hypothetical protein SKAU_G00261390 [Synaphobranchus kaupii]
MDFMKLLGTFLSVCCYPSTASKLFSADFYEPRGQRICRRGTQRPCYKIAYFQDMQRKVNFEEASRACRSDGGELLSIETESEQRLIETFIQELRASDGDFWIGLRRSQGYQETSSDCPVQYHWLDGSQATFRNWHWDEPSCGYEWNDDNCDTKNNFICKYSREKEPDSTAAGNVTHTDSPTMSLRPKYPAVTVDDAKIKVEVSHSTDSALNIAYIVLPTIPLLLLLLVASGVFCFKLLARRRKDQTETCPKEPGYWVSADRCNSPSPDVYNVISKQHESDLTGTRPDIKNTSFLGSSPDTPPGDYDNLAGRDTESGFVTLASTESGFVTNDIYDTYQSRGRYYRETGWVDNEIYGY